MKPMKKTEYRKAIEALGLSQAAAGRFLEAAPRTGRRYAGGGQIPGAVAILLRYMLRKRLKPADVKPDWKEGPG